MGSSRIQRIQPQVAPDQTCVSNGDVFPFGTLLSKILIGIQKKKKSCGLRLGGDMILAATPSMGKKSVDNFSFPEAHPSHSAS